MALNYRDVSGVSISSQYCLNRAPRSSLFSSTRFPPSLKPGGLATNCGVKPRRIPPRRNPLRKLLGRTNRNIRLTSHPTTPIKAEDLWPQSLLPSKVLTEVENPL